MCVCVYVCVCVVCSICGVCVCFVCSVCVCVCMCMHVLYALLNLKKHVLSRVCKHLGPVQIRCSKYTVHGKSNNRLKRLHTIHIKQQANE